MNTQELIDRLRKRPALRSRKPPPPPPRKPYRFKSTTKWDQYRLTQAVRFDYQLNHTPPGHFVTNEEAPYVGDWDNVEYDDTSYIRSYSAEIIAS